jgi:hypothetical protein
MRAAVALLLPALALAGCNKEPPKPQPVETEIPKELAQNPAPVVEAGNAIGTPMKDRVATLGLLNKRNNISQDLTMKPGESRRIGNVIVRLEACEKTAPWEYDPEEGAFVQVFVRERSDISSPLAWHKIFSGWLFRNSPGVNVVEHPIYDVWVKSCAMSFPGEDAPAPTSSAKPSGTPAPAPETPPSVPAPSESAAPAPAA